MGKAGWDAKRQEVYASTDYHCAACGAHKSNAKKHRWLEAHEIFEIDYRAGTATLVEIVPLCHYCHAFIHLGLTRIRARKEEITAYEVQDTMQHGVDVLRQVDGPIFLGTAELCELVKVDYSDLNLMGASRAMADWGKWRMIWNGERYKGKFRSLRDWPNHYARA